MILQVFVPFTAAKYSQRICKQRVSLRRMCCRTSANIRLFCFVAERARAAFRVRSRGYQWLRSVKAIHYVNSWQVTSSSRAGSECCAKSPLCPLVAAHSSCLCTAGLQSDGNDLVNRDDAFNSVCDLSWNFNRLFGKLSEWIQGIQTSLMMIAKKKLKTLF